MSEYVKNAETEAAAYEKQRKKQTEDSVAQLNAAAADAVDAAGAQTATAIRERERAWLDTVDTAAVQRAITDKQVKERLAALGLSASGLADANAHAATVTERRTAQKATRTRDEAVAALTEALTRAEQEIEHERAAAELKARQSAEQDTARNRESLLKAAYAAEAKEEAARESAAARVEAARIKAESAKKEAAEGDRFAEQNRRGALKVMYEAGTITADLYAQALEKGWSTEEAARQSRRYARYNAIAEKARKVFADQGFEAMMRYTAPYSLTDNEWELLCDELKLSHSEVKQWMAGYTSYLHSTPAAEAMLKLFEGGVRV